MELNKNDYELARPGLAPLTLAELRPSMAPGEYYAKTHCEKEFLINEQTLADKRDDNPNRLRPISKAEPVTVFEIREGKPDQSKETWNLLETHDNLDDAKVALAKLKASAPNWCFAMRKNTQLLTTNDPRAWAEERFATGEWERPRWLEEQPWVKDISHEQLLHLSVGQPGNFAYYPTRAAALNDRCAIESAAQYLARNYADVLEPDEIAQIVYQSDPPGTLKFTGSDGDAIAHVYKTSGISSCMTNRSAVRIYGAGDIEMMTLERDGRIIARALCWPERKFVGNMYGDVVRMKIAIECAGYTRDFKGQSSSQSQGLGGFEGARLLKIKAPKGWLMPYIDLGYRVWDDGQFFRLSKVRGVNVNNTGNTFAGTIPYFAPQDLKEAA